MNVVVATHGHCFDGMASAALFTRLLRHADPREATFVYRACGYGVNQARPDARLLSGDVNAILDFRFAPEPSLTWYFDHHRTAFQSEADRAAFERRSVEGRFFFDAEYSSCTKLIVDVAREKLGLVFADLAELVEWADLIDAARFPSAEDAVSRTNPILRLASVVEHHGDDRFLGRMVPLLLERPLAEVAASPMVSEKFAPLGEKLERFVERVRHRCEVRGRVVYCDLTDTVLETVGKFVTYALHPETTYSVIVGRLASGVKISVGYNPWSREPLDTDVSEICARHGGGGHRAVGGIAFPVDQVERARAVATAIATELAG